MHDLALNLEDDGELVLVNGGDTSVVYDDLQVSLRSAPLSFELVLDSVLPFDLHPPSGPSGTVSPLSEVVLGTYSVPPQQFLVVDYYVQGIGDPTGRARRIHERSDAPENVPALPWGWLATLVVAALAGAGWLASRAR